MRTHRAFLPALSLLLAGTLAACGSGGNDRAASVSAKTLQLAAANSQDAESSRFRSTVTIESGGERVEVEMVGVGSADGKRVSIVAEVPELGTFEERIVDGVVYLELGAIPEAATELPVGKRWVAIDFEEMTGLSESALWSLSEQAQQNTPQQGLASLRGLSGDVEDLGPDTVGGRPATHYRGAIDYGKLADDLDDLPDATRAAFESLGESGKVPVDVWVDEADRVVKMQFAFRIPSQDGERGARIEMTMEITEFGIPVDVQAPPADDVVTYDELTTMGPI